MREPEAAGRVTELLQRWRGGDERALDALMPLVYEELRRLADRQMQGERADHTLQPTALVSEAYIRLAGMDVGWEDRVHFMSMAARQMRRILIDHAKAARRQKRGGGAVRVTLDESLLRAGGTHENLLELDEALTRLSVFDARKARAVEMHFFGGLTYDETAAALGVSAATVDRDLRLAKAWLADQLRE